MMGRARGGENRRGERQEPISCCTVGYEATVNLTVEQSREQLRLEVSVDSVHGRMIVVEPLQV